MKKNNLARGEQVRMRNGSESVTESLHPPSRTGERAREAGLF